MPRALAAGLVTGFRCGYVASEFSRHYKYRYDELARVRASVGFCAGSGRFSKSAAFSSFDRAASGLSPEPLNPALLTQVWCAVSLAWRCPK